MQSIQLCPLQCNLCIMLLRTRHFARYKLRRGDSRLGCSRGHPRCFCSCMLCGRICLCCCKRFSQRRECCCCCIRRSICINRTLLLQCCLVVQLQRVGCIVLLLLQSAQVTWNCLFLFLIRNIL